MWGCEDVSMSGCEDVRRWRCEDVRMWRCEHVWQTPTIRRTLRSEALGNNMSFDSDCLSGASPGANPLWGQKRHETVDIWHLTRVSYHSSSSPSPFIIVIVIAIITVVVIIITIIIFLVYYLLVSSLLLSFMPRFRLVFLSMCECCIKFWSKTSSSISPFRY